MLKPEDKVLLDVCCGRWGWSKEFAKRGWKCIGIDLLEHETPPEGCKLIRMNLLSLGVDMLWNLGIKFVVASTPCDEFALWGMRHFHKEPKLPRLGITLFQYIHRVCFEAKVPFVMENVRAAQQFVGDAQNHCGSFFLWGNAVPPIMPQGIKKGATQMRRNGDFARRGGVDERMYAAKDKRAAELAIIPPELAACVADYAERILEQRKEATYAKEASAVSSESVRYSLNGREASEGEYKLRRLAERQRAED